MCLRETWEWYYRCSCNAVHWWYYGSQILVCMSIVSLGYIFPVLTVLWLSVSLCMLSIMLCVITVTKVLIHLRLQLLRMHVIRICGILFVALHNHMKAGPTWGTSHALVSSNGAEWFDILLCKQFFSNFGYLQAVWFCFAFVPDNSPNHKSFSFFLSYISIH